MIGIVMGSDSDLPVMKQAVEVIEQFNIPYEINIISAHRTPEKALEYANTAEERGLKVIIAGAAGAAHLPGVIAALTTIPVIGVPIRSSTLDGLDSLLSIIQMPLGIPVATVAINNAKNAGLLAISILSISDKDIGKKLKEYRQSLKESVLEKDKKLKEIGYENYLKDMKK